jgi:hypothetical protein
MVLIYKSGLLFIGMQRIHRFVSMRRMETRLSAGMANSETLFYFYLPYSISSICQQAVKVPQKRKERKEKKGVKSAVDFLFLLSYKFQLCPDRYA